MSTRGRASLAARAVDQWSKGGHETPCFFRELFIERLWICDEAPYVTESRSEPYPLSPIHILCDMEYYDDTRPLVWVEHAI